VKEMSLGIVKVAKEIREILHQILLIRFASKLLPIENNKAN
jgi:hypothetical protein